MLGHSSSVSFIPSPSWSENNFKAAVSLPKTSAILNRKIISSSLEVLLGKKSAEYVPSLLSIVFNSPVGPKIFTWYPPSKKFWPKLSLALKIIVASFLPSGIISWGRTVSIDFSVEIFPDTVVFNWNSEFPIIKLFPLISTIVDEFKAVILKTSLPVGFNPKPFSLNLTNFSPPKRLPPKIREILSILNL